MLQFGQVISRIHLVDLVGRSPSFGGRLQVNQQINHTTNKQGKYNFVAGRVGLERVEIGSREQAPNPEGEKPISPHRLWGPFSPQILKSVFLLSLTTTSLDTAPVRPNKQIGKNRQRSHRTSFSPLLPDIFVLSIRCTPDFDIWNSAPQPRTKMAAEEDEVDYMSMVIEEPQQKETFTQKKRRLQREVRGTRRAYSSVLLLRLLTRSSLLGRSPRKSSVQSRTCRPGSCQTR